MNALTIVALTIPFFALASLALKDSLDLYCKAKEISLALEMTTRSLHSDRSTTRALVCGGRILLEAKGGELKKGHRQIYHLVGGL